MGRITELTEWASDGDKTEPSASKYEDGWIAGEQPPCEWENFVQNGRDLKANELIRDLNFRDNEPPTKDIAANFADYDTKDDMHQLYSAKNKATLSSNLTYLCKGYNYTLSQYTVFAINTVASTPGSPVIIYEYYNDKETGEIDVIEHSINLESANAESLTNLVCDGEFLFLVTLDGTATVSYVYKFAINPWSGSGDSEDYCVTTTPRIISSICLAYADKLGVLTSGYTGADAPVGTIVISTMTFDTFGRGNLPASSTPDIDTVTGLVSDGINLYFCAEDDSPGVNNYFCAAKITTRGVPDAAGLATCIEITDTDYDQPDGALRGIYHECGQIYMMFSGADTLGVFIYDTINDFFQDAHPLLENTGCNADSSSTSNKHLVFDGKRLWLCAFEHDVTTGKGVFIAPIQTGASPKINREMVLDKRYYTTEIAGITSTIRAMAYSDDSVWLGYYESGGPVKELRRLPAISRLS